MLVEIVGIALVFDDDDKLVTDHKHLGRFDNYHDEERFTDYLGGPTEENELLAALEPSGHLVFRLPNEGTSLKAKIEYKARRPLTDEELSLLFEYTMGQWDDGVGENIATETGITHGLSVQCQTQNPVPQIRQIDPNDVDS